MRVFHLWHPVILMSLEVQVHVLPFWKPLINISKDPDSHGCCSTLNVCQTITINRNLLNKSLYVSDLKCTPLYVWRSLHFSLSYRGTCSNPYCRGGRTGVAAATSIFFKSSILFCKSLLNYSFFVLVPQRFGTSHFKNFWSAPSSMYRGPPFLLTFNPKLRELDLLKRACPYLPE